MSDTRGFVVRPADPSYRREHADAHEVVVVFNGRPYRSLGVWRTQRAAVSVATTLDIFGGEQVR